MLSKKELSRLERISRFYGDEASRLRRLANRSSSTDNTQHFFALAQQYSLVSDVVFLVRDVLMHPGISVNPLSHI